MQIERQSLSRISGLHPTINLNPLRVTNRASKKQFGSDHEFSEFKTWLLGLILFAGIVMATFAVNKAAPPSASGYISLEIGPGFQLVADPLRGQDNTVAHLFPQPTEGTELYKLVNGVFTTNTFSSGVWTQPDETLAVGDGALVFNPSAETNTVTFVGEILQGDLTNTIPAGLSLKSSLIPKGAPITSGLGLKLSAFDNLYQWKSNRFEVFTFLPNGGWFPSKPKIKVGEAFFIRASQETNWVIKFKA